MTSFLHRLPPADDGLAGAGRIDAGSWSSELPALVEFLGAASWSDGSPRLPGTLTLFTDQLMWKLCLSDKDQGRIAFVSGLSPSEALLAAERGLVANSLDWRASSPPRRRKGS